MDLNQTFARSVRKLRHELGLSQEDLGEQSGLTRNYIGMIERGETSPTLDTVEAIAQALGKRAKELL